MWTKFGNGSRLKFGLGGDMQIIRRDFLRLAVSTAIWPCVAQADTGPINILHLGAVGLTTIVLHVAHGAGFFAKRGVNVQLVPVTGTAIPELTDANPVGHIGAPAAILKAARGSQLRILASLDSGQLFNQLVVHPSIKKPEDLKGKRLGARVKGAALWIHTVIALEKLGLDPWKDNIDILPIGDPGKVMQALEAGEIQGAVLSRAQSRQLADKGYSVLIDLASQDVYGATDALVATPKFMQDHPGAIEGVVFGRSRPPRSHNRQPASQSFARQSSGNSGSPAMRPPTRALPNSRRSSCASPIRRPSDCAICNA
jgi:ABC-type nitrate/sulfonate/bicarbonate transport system substrate-binding protein